MHEGTAACCFWQARLPRQGVCARLRQYGITVQLRTAGLAHYLHGCIFRHVCK